MKQYQENSLLDKDKTHENIVGGFSYCDSQNKVFLKEGINSEAMPFQWVCILTRNKWKHYIMFKIPGLLQSFMNNLNKFPNQHY